MWDPNLINLAIKNGAGGLLLALLLTISVITMLLSGQLRLPREITALETQIEALRKLVDQRDDQIDRQQALFDQALQLIRSDLLPRLGRR